MKEKKRKSPARIIAIIFGVLWLLSIGVFVLNIVISTNFFRGMVDSTTYGKSDLAGTILIGSMVVGFLSFFLMALILILDLFVTKKVVRFKKTPFGILLFLLKSFLLLTILPLFLIYKLSGISNIFKKNKEKGTPQPKSVVARIILIAVVLLTLGPMWGGGYYFLGAMVGLQLGYVSQPIGISGTGSMYPTFPKGEGKDPKELAKQILAYPGMLPYPNGLVLFGNRLLGHQIGRGDIVVVENEKTKESNKNMYGDSAGSGWVKRVIGIAGDSIELREGVVYLNDKPQAEPYTAKPHSTFGEGFLKECQKVVVPQDSVFVMGDNRKGSGDSREIGFFELEDIKNVLPLKGQKGDLAKNWRDTSKDFDESTKIKIDKEQYLKLLNEKRTEAKVKPLKYQPELELSAQKRGEVILKYNDFSFEATRSGYTMGKAMRDAKYSNTTWGEAPTLGYYDAEELIDNQFEFPETKKFLLNKEYQDIGIAEVEGTLNGCPAQILVQHFAGYVPPNYEQSLIDSWQKTLESIRGIQAGWSDLKNYTSFYNQHKDEVDRINEIISTRISRMESFIATMKANKWLSSEQEGWMKEDQGLYNEQQALSSKLNSYH